MSVKITGLILTFNEEIHIERCIKSMINTCNEIIVIDSFSTDQTLKICKRYKKVKIYKRKYLNHANQLNWALKNLKIKSKWMIRIDADEIIEKNFYNKLNKIKNLDKYYGLNIIVEHNFMGKRIKYGGVYPQFQIRMWKKNFGYYDNRPMDEKIVINKNNIFNSNLRIVDNNLKGMKFWFAKHAKYAHRESKLYRLLINKKIKTNKYNIRSLDKSIYYKFPILLRPFFLFIYRYFIKKGFLDGFTGLKFIFYQTLYYRLLVDINIINNFFRKNK
jgi:glycosyltransferase involved in cell wall biosynthesis